jgi:hypothetical protein
MQTAVPQRSAAEQVLYTPRSCGTTFMAVVGVEVIAGGSADDDPNDEARTSGCASLSVLFDHLVERVDRGAEV